MALSDTINKITEKYVELKKNPSNANQILQEINEIKHEYLCETREFSKQF